MKFDWHGKWRQTWAALGICGLFALVTFLTARIILRRTAWITLPDAVGTAGISVSDPVGAGGPVTPLEINPRTVRAAVATLRRSPDYAREIKITQFWTGGSGSYQIDVYASGGWTRTDRRSGGRVRHVLTNGETCHIWYDNGPDSVQIPAGGITSDDEQYIPVYEDVLSLPPDLIIAANYQRHEERNCIYLETSGDDYIRRYWIDVDSGLLNAAEILFSGDIIFRMESSEADVMPENAFILPDGTSVL